MCGICGKISWDAPIDVSVVSRMMETMSHRGPDDAGLYSEPYAALGHRRLSIIDLETGKQPLTNETGSVIVVFNGEIYNYRELREDLLARGHQFATTSDTEVIAHLYEERGEACVEELRGMFAFAIWDSPKRRLFLARDRVGIKPLYVARIRNGFLFASEIKALLVDPLLSATVDPQGIDRFLTFSYMPGQGTLLRGIEKILPGHHLVVQDGQVTTTRYWDLAFDSSAYQGTFEEATAQLHDLLDHTVREHMRSDVPVGVLLSGGVDSTGLLSFCCEQTDRPINTFTVGFSGESFEDERWYASLAARQYGTTHHELTITGADFREFLPKYVWHMEEPVCEPPAVALYYVTRLARDYVKVLISGEGGDEAFAGYQNYRNIVWIERLKALGPAWRRLFSFALAKAGAIKRLARFGKYSRLMRATPKEYYYSRTAGPDSTFNRIRNALYTPSFDAQVNETQSLDYLNECFSRIQREPLLSQLLYIDTKLWLPDDLLVKADKMTMANSVELRVPLLDHRVLEFAASLPAEYKVKGWTTKRILKSALDRRVPAPIVRRRKTGFPVPIGRWMREELHQFTADVLLDQRSASRGYFNVRAVEELLKRLKATGECVSEVFGLMVLELWHRQFVDARA